MTPIEALGVFIKLFIVDGECRQCYPECNSCDEPLVECPIVILRKDQEDSERVKELAMIIAKDIRAAYPNKRARIRFIDVEDELRKLEALCKETKEKT